MKHYHHTGSSLFLLELLLNLLLFCLLCGCGLKLFAKSHQLSTSAVSLQQAVSITSSIASLYESGDGSLAAICDAYSLNSDPDHSCTLYLDTAAQPCKKERAHAYVQMTPASGSRRLQIDYYDTTDTCIYSIQAVYHAPPTRAAQKEGSYEQK